MKPGKKAADCSCRQTSDKPAGQRACRRFPMAGGTGRLETWKRFEQRGQRETEAQSWPGNALSNWIQHRAQHQASRRKRRQFRPCCGHDEQASSTSGTTTSASLRQLLALAFALALSLSHSGFRSGGGGGMCNAEEAITTTASERTAPIADDGYYLQAAYAECIGAACKSRAAAHRGRR